MMGRYGPAVWSALFPATIITALPKRVKHYSHDAIIRSAENFTVGASGALVSQQIRLFFRLDGPSEPVPEAKKRKFDSRV